MTQGMLFQDIKFPGGAKGRVLRLLMDGGWTENHPLVAARLERGGSYGWNPDRYLRDARWNQPWKDFGIKVKSRPIRGSGTKPLEGFWIERSK